MPEQQKKNLNAVIAGCYIFPAITVLMVGCGSPCNTKATQSAARAFFVVVKTIFAIMRHFMAWCIHIRCAGYQTDAHGRMYHATMSMVAQAGPTSVGPVSFVSGTSTPVWAIASKCGSFSDRPLINHKGDRCYAQTPQKSHPKSDHHPPTQPRLSP
ncbi:hypothetical protein E0G79_25805 [Salmonella enterica]|nr:hypothetical protein [Salmonella enterica]